MESDVIMPARSQTFSRPFIVSNGANETDPHTRKLIRSYVMRGKNRGKTRHNKSEDAESSAQAVDRRPRFLVTDQELLILYPKVGTDLAFFPFADTIEPKAAANALNAAITVAKARYVLETCLIFSDLGTSWIRQLSIDASFLQSFILMCEVYFDIVRGDSSTYSGQVNVLKTIQLLRKKLSFEDVEAQVSDATVFVILNLAVHAFLNGDDKTARHHMLGIRKIVDLRGGINQFPETKMLLELLRCDLELVLHTGSKSLFFQENDPAWQQLLEYPSEVGCCRETDRTFYDLDNELVTAWNSMKGFCSLINLAVEAHGRIPWTLYLNTMTPVMYRLLCMKFDPDSVEEVVRLGLLVFSSQIFLQWKVITAIYGRLTASYKSALDRLDRSTAVPPYIITWLLMIGGVSVSENHQDTWFVKRLRENVKESAIDSWGEMQNLLRSLLWIGVVQDRLGREVFDHVLNIPVDGDT